MSSSSSEDAAARAMTDDGAFRVIAVKTTNLSMEAAGTQCSTPEETRWFSELLTTAILVRETMAPQLRVQTILVGENQKDESMGRLVADSHPDGSNRGVLLKAQESCKTGRWTQLQVMRTLPSKQVHQGVVSFPAGGTLSGALMEYMQSSEQIVSVARVGCIMDGNKVHSAGGFLLQLLPEVTDPPLAIMTERLSDFQEPESYLLPSSSSDKQVSENPMSPSPEEMLETLLEGFPYTLLEHKDLRFGCHCSQVRVLASLATVRRKEIESMIAEGKTVEMDCNYCGRSYRVNPGELRGLLRDS